MAVIAFPTYAYYQTAGTANAPQTVASQAALTALGPNWGTNPVASAGAIAPADPGFTDTDIRLQQILVELRVMNQMLYANTINLADDPSVLRSDVLAVDVGLSS